MSEQRTIETEICRACGGPMSMHSRAACDPAAAQRTTDPLLALAEQLRLQRGERSGKSPEETSAGHTCHNGATIYLAAGEMCRWCDAVNDG